MAFLTGTFSPSDGLADLLGKLKDFADDDGWTINYGTYPYLLMNKGSVYVNLFARVDATVDNRAAGGTATDPDYQIKGHLSTGYTFNASPSTQFFSQPGSLIVPGDTVSDSDLMLTNDLLPPYSNYWFFSGADGEPDYIHMVIQKADGHFCSMHMGMVDKKGATYTGGEFLSGFRWHWWFSNGTTIGDSQGSDIAADHRWMGDSGGNYNVHIGDVSMLAPMKSHNSVSTVVPLMSRIHGQYALENIGVTFMGWLHHVFYVGYNPINGVSPMFEVPIFIDRTTDFRMAYMGAIPGYRWLSMKNRLEAEEITFGSDNWMVFPFKRNLPFNPEPFASKTVTSGYYGHAFKINA